MPFHNNKICLSSKISYLCRNDRVFSHSIWAAYEPAIWAAHEPTIEATFYPAFETAFEATLYATKRSTE